MKDMIDMPLEKLLVWQKAIVLVDVIYEITANFPKEEVFGLVSQMRRAAVSIASNLAEGSQRGSQKEFGHFTLMAKGSLAELRTQAYISKRRKSLSSDDWENFSLKAKELDKMIRSFYLALTRKKSE